MGIRAALERAKHEIATTLLILLDRAPSHPQMRAALEEARAEAEERLYAHYLEDPNREVRLP